MSSAAWHAMAVLLSAPFLGSFAGLLIKRVPTRRPVAFARSRCVSCGRKLSAGDLIPLLSWSALRGKCRRCGNRIGCFYPLVELGAVAIAAWSVLVLPGALVWAGVVLGLALLVLAVIDYEHLLLPNGLTLALLAIGLAVTMAVNPARITHHVLGAIGGWASFAATDALYRMARGRPGMGGGDAKLLAALGAWVGWQGLPSIVACAAVVALLYAAAAALAGKQLTFSTRIPFGPALCAAGWLVWLYGPLQI